MPLSGFKIDSGFNFLRSFISVVNAFTCSSVCIMPGGICGLHSFSILCSAGKSHTIVFISFAILF